MNSELVMGADSRYKYDTLPFQFTSSGTITFTTKGEVKAFYIYVVRFTSGNERGYVVTNIDPTTGVAQYSNVYTYKYNESSPTTSAYSTYVTSETSNSISFTLTQNAYVSLAYMY